MTDPYDPNYRQATPVQRGHRPLDRIPAAQYRQAEPTYYPPQGYAQPPAHGQHPPKSRRKRRIFLWVFLAIQVIFIIWLIAGLATKPGGPSVAQQTAQVCAHGGWQGLFKSHADCVQHYGVALNDAGNTGKAIGAGIIVLLWVVVDFFLGIGYGVYKLATR